jgi:hypothetical protein
MAINECNDGCYANLPDAESRFKNTNSGQSRKSRS